MNRNLIKKIIAICCIFIFIIVILIINLKIKQKKINNALDEKIEETVKIDEEFMIQHEDSERFFTVAQCVSSYLDIINKNNSNYFGYNENEEFTKIVNENEGIYNILSKEYIEKNNINIDNAGNFVQNVEKKLFFIPLKMNYIKNNEDNNLYQYAVYGYITDMDYQLSQYLYIIVNMDFKNNTFSIEPIKEEIKEISEIKLEYNKEPIEKNNYNLFTYKVLNDEVLTKTYLDYYKKMMLGNPKLAYEYLDNEYKEKRFSTVEKFEKYINDNKEAISTIQLSKYQRTVTDDYTQYVCIDQNQNYYIFREIAIMDYSVILDTYTIDLPEFLEKYNTASEDEKALLNVQKIFKAIELKDYEYVYSKLNETFKNNNFSDYTNFETYFKSNLFEENIFEYKKIEQQGNVYISTITIKNKSNTDESKKINVIVQLTDTTDYYISFSFE